MLLIDREFKLDQINEILDALIFHINIDCSVILLNGEIGAGKTTFIKYLLERFNINKNTVQSPTYNILLQYNGSINNKKNIIIKHYDLYNANADMLFELDLMQNLLSGICIIEWPRDNIKSSYILKNAISINLDYVNEVTRKIKIYVPFLK